MSAVFVSTPIEMRFETARFVGRVQKIVSGFEDRDCAVCGSGSATLSM